MEVVKINMADKFKKNYTNTTLTQPGVKEIFPTLNTVQRGGASKNYGQVNLLKSYTKNLLKDAKPLIDKSLKKSPLESRNFKGAIGAPLNVKEKLLTIDKLQKVNNENAMFDKANPNIIRNTRNALNNLEKQIKSKFMQTDVGKKFREEENNFRRFLRKQKNKITISTDYS
jgi:hypothetical protein